MSHLRSSALRCAVELGVPTAINRCGGTATIADIVNDIEISEAMYKLTPVSRLLVNDDGDGGACDLSALVLLFTRPSTTVAWFKDSGEKTPFEMAHGMSPWAFTLRDAAYNDAMNHACVADSTFLMDLVLREASGVFTGITSLVDVGGGYGIAAQAISKAFPHIACSVLDLEQVINKAPDDGKVKFVVGDMFHYIPPADAILLEAVLNCWDDDSCVKVLRQCRKAIPSRGTGGKVIIMNTVIGYGNLSEAVREAQLLSDMYMLRGEGFERDDNQWKKVILEVGFSEYTVMPVLGPVAILVVQP